MNSEQFSAIYLYLINQAKEKGTNSDLFSRLKKGRDPSASIKKTDKDTSCIDAAILLIPLYSTGRAANLIEESINKIIDLINGKKTLSYFSQVTLDEMESACPKIVSPTASNDFFAKRYYPIKARAQFLIEHNLEYEEFKKIYDEECKKNVADRSCPEKKELETLYNFLKKMYGISYAASMHILMDLGFSIVKPDRHIQRILRRTNGEISENRKWSDLFTKNNEDKEIKFDKLYEIQREWNLMIDKIKKSSSEETNKIIQITNKNLNLTDYDKLPEIHQLTSRQFDTIFMLYTQDIKKDLNAIKPICVKNPTCTECNVPNCSKNA